MYLYLLIQAVIIHGFNFQYTANQMYAAEFMDEFTMHLVFQLFYSSIGKLLSYKDCSAMALH